MTKDVLRDHLAHGVDELQQPPVVINGWNEPSSHTVPRSDTAFLSSLGFGESEISTIRKLAASHAETVQDFIVRVVRLYFADLAEQAEVVDPGAQSETAVDTAR